MSTSYKITLVGYGKMGTALLRGWQASDIPADFTVIDPHNAPPTGTPHFKNADEAAEILQETDVLILAVKPQIMAEICQILKAHTPLKTLVISIAAGQSLSTLGKALPPGQPIIRTMPNTPAAIGKGITVCIANSAAQPQHKKLATRLFETAGKVEWLTDENLLDGVTALSGSGPAYVFYLIEILAKTGQSLGLAPDFATTLARQTIIGAAALAENDAHTPAETLRQNVTSPGGTTQAALDILMDGRVQAIFNEALLHAQARSRKLGN
ncbi:MAG: pyrroline-5-carboxylate reductase [Alphaproteobacteria bacterium]|nr:pyrroline-5-carboxylate reductase [Alphaproteobacteria bacterium]